jgi:hypothetical protein
VRLLGFAVVLVAAAAVAGCGGSKAAPPSPPPVSKSACALTPAAKRDLAKANRDLAALRRLVARTKRWSDMGTPALQAATGKFLDDLTTSHLDNYRQMRLIDYAASSVSAVCNQCFQILESNRPIPAMKASPTRATCT